LISIIIPVFNAEKYIHDCLNSIIQQKSDIEIICIDDGSTDNSLSILKDFQKKDKRIRLFTQKNQGLSSARNLGIKLSNSDFLLFIDADDYITKNAIYLLSNFVLKNKFDIIFFNFSKTEPFIETDIVEVESTNKSKIIECVISMEISTSVCFCIINKKLFIENRIEFPIKKYYEDAFILHKILHHSNSPCKIKNSLYFYRTTPGSITNSTDKKKIDDLFLSIDEIFDFIEYHNYPNHFFLVEGRFCILINISLSKINQDWFNTALFKYFLFKTIYYCKKYRINISIIYTFFYTTYKLNFNYFEILSDSFSRLLIRNNSFKDFLVTNKDINKLYDLIELKILDKFYFWGKNSTSDLLIAKNPIENFGGYIISDFSYIDNNDHQIFKLCDLNFNEKFTIIIFSLYSAHVIKQRILNYQHYNPSYHQVIDYIDLLSLHYISNTSE
jgi:glycosyltransferase involved in cell wall biosynthesis